MSEHTKCMVPHLVKRGERLTIEGVEYVITRAWKEEVPFYGAEIVPYVSDSVAPDSTTVDEVIVGKPVEEEKKE